MTSTEEKGGRMSLSNIKRGRIDRPIRVLMYGPEGIGKSTFGAGAPEAVFIGSEDGTAQLDVARFPSPERWEDIHLAVDELRNGEHEFKTAVFDTLDWMEPICWDFVCRSAGKPDIESFGYGKGYVAAVDTWRSFLVELDRLRNDRSMNIVLLAHSHIRKFQNPEGEDFDRYTLKLHEKSAGLLKEWVDDILFANFEILSAESKGRVRGVSTGVRRIHTERAAAFDAKNRHNLPVELPLDWEEYFAAVKAGGEAAALREGSVRELMEAAPPALKKKSENLIKRAAGDPRKLAQLEEWLKNKLDDLPKEQAPEPEAVAS